jgi:hypothetical protein
MIPVKAIRLCSSLAPVCPQLSLHERTAAVSGRVKKREDLCIVNVAADC